MTLQVNIPLNKDQRKYFISNSGLSTKKWGPSGWNFLYSCIMGGYPIKIDENNKEHVNIKNHFINMFENLGYVMPCIFCRESFKDFYKKIPIQPYLIGRLELMYWLYLINDNVNQKLIKQERKCYKKEKKKLLKQLDNNEINQEYFNNCIKELKISIFITQHTPPFVDVLYKYEHTRAVCSKKSKRCL